MTDKTETRGQRRKSGCRSWANQELHRFLLPRRVDNPLLNGGVCGRPATPYQPLSNLALPQNRTRPMLAQDTGSSNRTLQQDFKDVNAPNSEDDMGLLNERACLVQHGRHTMSIPSHQDELHPAFCKTESLGVVVNTEEPLCLPFYQTPSSSGAWDMANKLLTLRNTVYPTHGSVFTPLLESPRFESYRVSPDFRDFAAYKIPAISIPEQVQHFAFEDSITLPTYLSNFSAKEELQIARELEEISN